MNDKFNCCNKERKITAHRAHILNKHGVMLSNKRCYVCSNCRSQFLLDVDFQNHKITCRHFIKPKRYDKLVRIAPNKFVLNNIN